MKRKYRAVLWCCVLTTLLPVANALATIERRLYEAGGIYLLVEILDDDLIHVEAGNGPPPAVSAPITTSPMVAATQYSGPTEFVEIAAGVLETRDLRVIVELTTLCLTITELSDPPHDLLECCPRDLGRTTQHLTLTTPMTHVYGLGEQFRRPGVTNGDWAGHFRSSGNAWGNAQVPFNGGAVGNDQFPIAYLLGAAGANVALFVDMPTPQIWALRTPPWSVRTIGTPLRWYVLTGADLPDLRRDYLELVGRPPVPPRKAFGLWVSEYGYDNWTELDDQLTTLRQAGFPVDGFMLDLQWFGGVQPNSVNSPMGGLTWDRLRFPDPTSKLHALETNQGVGVMTIEEPYVSGNLPEHTLLETFGYLVRECAFCGPVGLSAWWGAGGMIDWTQPQAGDVWHNLKRAPLVDAGVIGHWTDLGEPESFDPGGWFHGDAALGGHTADRNHILYNLLWSRSIHDGYANSATPSRPLSLTRSGTSGSQRYGVAMWSGDIGSNLSSLAAHLNVRMHMALAGVDYYGSDVGGFHRSALDGDLDELYTIWFANAAAVDVPLRPHTENLCNCKETAPDRIGDLASNRANLQRRYRLIPYHYSLAHTAQRYGTPVFPPLVWAYQDDAIARELGDQTLIGSDLMVAHVTEYGQTARSVYLPAGVWCDFHRHNWFDSSGGWTAPISLTHAGAFTLPLFARAGALIPMMHVDEQTMNVFGRRLDESQRDELILRVYPAATASSFTLYEDDGRTRAYLAGERRTTQLIQQRAGNTLLVLINGAVGTYPGAPNMRDNILEIVLPPGASVASVALGGTVLAPVPDRAAFNAAAAGWFVEDSTLLHVRSGVQPVTSAKTFIVRLTFDCNGNGALDADDIASGSSPDYDRNGVPDDCQPDGAPDACDVDALLGCIHGPEIALDGLCRHQDRDADGDGDMHDVTIRQPTRRGAGRAGRPVPVTW